MIRDGATQRQVDAANPQNSTWLSANAGSGKTRVLTDRVARLLLDGVDPQNILCLTYTKAAAAEMQNRLFKRLGVWAMMDNKALHEELRGLGHDRTIDGKQLRNARTLFASAIETPGGLKIQTIHSFCASILRRFPLEAGVSPQFREMEDRQAELLRNEVVDALVLGTDSHVVHDLLQYFTGEDLGKLIAEIGRHRDAFLAVPDDATLREILDIAPNMTRDMLLGAVFMDGAVETLTTLRKVLRTGSVTDAKAADKLDALDLTKTPTLSDVALLETVFLTGASAKQPFSAKIDNFPTKAVRAANPELIDDLAPIMEIVQAARNDRLAINALERTQAIYAFGAKFVPAYEARKLAMGMLDFDDLIRKARKLLTDPLLATWVLFRLDGGIEHLLVDEAQDTSPDQWAVIERLTQEFASGIGAQPDRHRTIFVVGDKKQSIYSFQGADPDEFDKMRSHFEQGLGQIDQRLEQMTLDHSFRSSQAILRVVDMTFVRGRAAGLGREISHVAFKSNMPGRVDLWPVIPPNEKEDTDRDWTDPVDQIGDAHHVVQMATRVAQEITRMIAQETLPEEIDNTGTYQRRKINEGDILILVQRRSELFSEIIRACKSAGLNIAGADRLRLNGVLAVKDIAAVLNFLALPEDDLSLAAALRSPLFGWSEQDLYTLAHHRPEKTFLWAALRNNDAHPITRAVLDDLRKSADFLRPYDLIERILTRHDGRRKLLARLGVEAEDGIDALLSQALAYENAGVPSLTGFLTWLQTDDIEIKRQMDSKGDKIRVMTVHGAKGLEAPIVILPDTAKRDNVVKSELYPAGEHLIWKMNKDVSPPAIDALRDAIAERQAQERMRLLYVAMTRAEKWLIVGAAGNVGEGDESWYNIVADGLTTAGDSVEQVGEMPVRRVAHLDWNAPAFVEKAVDPISPVVIPDFGPVTLPPSLTALAPSELGGAKVMPGDLADVDADAARIRGTLIHLLMEHLPNTPTESRIALGEQLIAASETDHIDLVAQAIGLLDNKGLANLFASDALAEVDITATIPALGGRRIHGAIDRLIVMPDRVLAVDYKSNHLVPDTADNVPEGLLRQMGAYHAALSLIYPDRAVEVAILWTQTATLMPLPVELVSAALNRVTLS